MQGRCRDVLSRRRTWSTNRTWAPWGLEVGPVTLVAAPDLAKSALHPAQLRRALGVVACHGGQVLGHGDRADAWPASAQMDADEALGFYLAGTWLAAPAA